MLVMDQYTRRIIGLCALQTNALTGANAYMMFNKILGNTPSPNYLSSDNDPLFQYFQWKANLRIYEIKEIKSIPFTPISHPFVERVIGTIRREYLDHIIFADTADLENKLNDFKIYYNQYRQHLSLQKTPEKMGGKGSKKTAFLKNYHWKNHCWGLFQTPIAA